MMDAVAAAVIAIVVGSPVAYYLGTRRSRLERLYDQQAGVIAELFKRLSEAQQALGSWANPFQSATVDRDQQRQRADERMNDFRDYFYSHSVWLDRDTTDKVETFLRTVLEMGYAYLDDLDERGYPRSKEGRDASQRIMRDLHPLRQQLEQDFRAILHPGPWWKFWR